MRTLGIKPAPSRDTTAVRRTPGRAAARDERPASGRLETLRAGFEGSRAVATQRRRQSAADASPRVAVQTRRAASLVQRRGASVASVIQRNGDDPFADLDPFKAQKEARARQEQEDRRLAEERRLAAEQQRREEQEQRRLAARAVDADALRGLFNVSDLPGGGVRPNDVDSATFARTAALYSDIREGSTSLQIAGLPFGFSGLALADVAQILRTSAGRTLVETLARGNKRVQVGLSANKFAAHQMPAADPKTLEQIIMGAPDTFANVSNGVGSGSSVNYYPGGQGGVFIEGRLATSDTVLFHELTHALHAAQGTTQTGTLTEADAGLGPGHRDVGVKKEEYATAGLGAWSGDAITENSYRRQMRAVLGDGEYARLLYADRALYNGVMG